VDLKTLTISSVHNSLVNKEYSSEELTNSYLDEIKKFNKDLNIYLTVTEKEAVSQAKKIDENLRENSDVPVLAGVPAAIKDIIITKDIRTTASSKILENFVPPYESTTTDRLNKQGMVTLGKTNCDAFAFGASTENSGYGPTHNPWNTKKVPGGSSGGSAAAVAAGLATYSIGTDTGGSIRQPAALCGVVGMKLTYGRASRFGLIAMASSFDTPGPITRTVEDAAIVTQVISGLDSKDATTVDLPVPDYTKFLNQSIKGKKIALLEESFGEGVEQGVKTSLEQAVKVLEQLGAEVTTISMPELQYGIAAYYILVPSEISSNMARFDGVRFGHQSDKAKSLFELQTFSRGEALEDEVKRRIMLGNYALSSGYYDAYYLKAAKVRTVIKQKFEQTFQKFDAIICPTSPTVAFDIGSKADDPLAMYLADIFTCPVNIAGLPGISVPCGFSEKLPVGLQIIGKAFDEGTVFQIAHAYEQATEWHTKFPEEIK
jgi:aspartyl-tRNA(Asn)/glutamyl-tRNA(Gln) amidotransferase subunit A